MIFLVVEVSYIIQPQPALLGALLVQESDASSTNSSSNEQAPEQAQPPAAGSSSSTATADSNPKIAGADSQQLQVSKEVIETLRNRVFGEL